ncbi:unnamed protein product [Lota lota]
MQVDGPLGPWTTEHSMYNSQSCHLQRENEGPSQPCVRPVQVDRTRNTEAGSSIKAMGASRIRKGLSWGLALTRSKHPAPLPLPAGRPGGGLWRLASGHTTTILKRCLFHHGE